MRQPPDPELRKAALEGALYIAHPVSSCEPLYEEIARLLDHASTTLDMATGILGEMAKGFSEEAKTLRNLRG